MNSQPMYPLPLLHPLCLRLLSPDELWPPAPSQRTSRIWEPLESIVWVMMGAGLQDAEYLYALQRLQHQSATTKTLIAQAWEMASAFPSRWGGYSSAGRVPPDWGDDGYQVDKGGQADGSSTVNTWKLAMGAELTREQGLSESR
jgi:hypothetical protein